MLRECVFLVSVCVLGVGSFSGRGFFCRDPDTGKLYPVNSTWPSSSFCGNYHCKLRRKNITSIEYAPLRQLNITNIKLLSDNATGGYLINDTTLYNTDEVSKSIKNTDKKTEPDILDKILPIKLGIKITENVENDNNETEKDRYLSDSEIRSLTELLHTVKKSDLDAIVEIYNLAQDIYKEIDKTSTEHVLNEAMFPTKNVNNPDDKSNVIRKAKKISHVSYWYEPLSSGKIRPAELLKTEMSRSETMRNDVIPIIPVVPADLLEIGPNLNVPLKPVIKKPVPPETSMSNSPPPPPYHVRRTDTYFTGALTKKDFGKLPYYYPISSFQRLSSYTHEVKKPKIESARAPKPIYQPIPVTHRSPVYGNGKYQKEIKQSILLPYPFSYIHHYNWSYPQNIYNRKNRLNKLDLTPKELTPKVVPRKKYEPETNNAVLMNPDLENFQDLEIKPIIKDDKSSLQQQKEERNKPDWQTDPLPKQILEEVKAHAEKQKLFIHPFPLRRRVKLERVGKVRKLDEIKRPKRSPINIPSEERQLEPELYEVYIERTTCNSDYSIPGFFRYGNLSQPFPECCPQRLSTR